MGKRVFTLLVEFDCEASQVCVGADTIVKLVHPTASGQEISEATGQLVAISFSDMFEEHGRWLGVLQDGELDGLTPDQCTAALTTPTEEG